MDFKLTIKELQAFKAPAHHKVKSYLIIDIMKRLERIIDEPYDYLMHLQLLNPSYRKRYRPRREAIRNVLQVMVYYCDFKTKNVGVPGSGGMDLKFIAKAAGINIKRCKRVIDDLVKAGYLETKKRCERYQDGVFKGLPSFKKLTDKFFAAIGVKKKKLDAMVAYSLEKVREAQELQDSLVHLIKNEVEHIRQKVKGVAKHTTEKIPRKISACLTRFFSPHG